MLMNVMPAAPRTTVQTIHSNLLRSGTTASDQGVCGHRWTGPTMCDSGVEHICTRTSPHHRSHMCACAAVAFGRSSSGTYLATTVDTARQG